MNKKEICCPRCNVPLVSNDSKEEQNYFDRISLKCEKCQKVFGFSPECLARFTWKKLARLS